MCLICTAQPPANQNRTKCSWSMNDRSHVFTLSLISNLRAGMRLLWKIIHTHTDHKGSHLQTLPTKNPTCSPELKETCCLEGITKVSVSHHVCGQTPVLFADNISPLWGEENQGKQSRWVECSPRNVIKHICYIDLHDFINAKMMKNIHVNRPCTRWLTIYERKILPEKWDFFLFWALTVTK